MRAWIADDVWPFADHSTREGLLGTTPSTDEYWEWLAVAMFLLVTVDLLTSMSAAAVVGLDAEANPIMRWVLTQPIWLIAAIHLGVIVLVSTCFAGILLALGRTEAPYDAYFALCIEVWLGVLVAAGLFIFANNVTVIVHGVSLF